MPTFREQPALLNGFRRGDADALEAVYRRYVDRIARLVRFIAGRGTHPSDLADTLQEIFIKAFSLPARQSFDAGREYGPYIATIARNVTVDRLRRGGHEIPVPLDDLQRLVDGAMDAVGGDDVDTSAWMIEAKAEVVRRYLEGLPAALKQLHQLRYVEGLSQRDAAERLGIGRQVLRTQEARLQEGLRRELDGAAAAPPAARARLGTGRS